MFLSKRQRKINNGKFSKVNALKKKGSQRPRVRKKACVNFSRVESNFKTLLITAFDTAWTSPLGSFHSTSLEAASVSFLLDQELSSCSNVLGSLQQNNTDWEAYTTESLPPSCRVGKYKIKVSPVWFLLSPPPGL